MAKFFDLDTPPSELLDEMYRLSCKNIRATKKIEELISKNRQLAITNIDLINKNIKAIEYINKFEDIRAYYSYEDNGYEEYNYDEDFKKDLLDILGDKNE